MTVEPVVVYPDADSNNASRKLMSSAMMNGTAPMRLMKVHIRATMTNASRVRMVIEAFLRGSQSKSPRPRKIAMVSPKDQVNRSCSNQERASGGISTVLNSSESAPSVRRITLGFIVGQG